MNDHQTETLGQLIQRIRDERGETDSSIARAIGVSPATVNSWSRGTRGGKRGPQTEPLRRLAATYGIPERDVFAAAGRATPAPLSEPAEQRLLALFAELTEDQQKILETQIRAIAEENHTGQ